MIQLLVFFPKIEHKIIFLYDDFNTKGAVRCVCLASLKSWFHSLLE